MNSMYDYSVVIPVYNSSLTLNILTIELNNILHGYTFELIFVDDNSIDDSWIVLNEIKKKYFDSKITLIKLSRNFGQDNATLCGLKYSKGVYVITIDDDLQHPSNEIKKLIKEINENDTDVVYGVFKNKKHSVLRNIGSKLFEILARKFGNQSGKGSAFRIIKNNIVEKIILHNQYFIRIEELIMWYTANIRYIEVDHNERSKGKSGYTKFKILKLTFNLMFNYSTIPLQLMVYIGFFVSFMSFIFAIFYVFKKIYYNDPVLGWTTIVVSILFSSGIIVFSLGVISQYLLRILTLQNNKPCYSVSQIIIDEDPII